MNPRLILVTGLVAVAPLAAVAAAGDVADSSQQIRVEQPAALSGVTVQGRLIAADTRQPFRDATVTLQPVTAAPDSPVLEAIALVPSNGRPVDADGRFEFTDVPRGSYRILATPLQTAMRYVHTVYPQASPDGPRSFSVSADQAPAEILIALPRGAAISGRVVDEHGAPYSQVSVSVPGERGRRRAWYNCSPRVPTTTGPFGSSVFRLASTSWPPSRRPCRPESPALLGAWLLIHRRTFLRPFRQPRRASFGFGPEKSSVPSTSCSSARVW